MSAEDLDLQWFASEDEGRTEEATPYSLEKARKEGQIPKSQDLNGSVVFFVITILLVVLARSILINCTEMMRFFFARCTQETITLYSYGYVFLNIFLRVVLPIAASGIFAAFLVNFAQNKGFIFTFKTITPNFKKIVPNVGKYLKNTLFSKKALFNVVKSLVKVFFIGFITYFLLRKNINEFVYIIRSGNIALSVSKIVKVAGQLLVIVAILFIVISIPDYFVQKRVFLEERKMTKYQVKQEYKEMEGDPEVKQRLEQARKQLFQNIPKIVREADVVITNPTHFAVVMKFDRNIVSAPQVMAKGVDEEALYIRRLANENNIPVVENRPLARSLYNEVNVGDIIPDEYLRVVANIYATVFKFNNKIRNSM